MMKLSKTRITSWMVVSVSVFILFWLWGAGIVHAAEPGQEMRRYTTVHITAEVPEGYDKDVIVYFNNEEGERPYLLSESEGYKRTIMIFEGEYQMSAKRKNSTDFLCEIEDTCTVAGNEMDFGFTVLSTPQEVTEQEAQAILENNAQPVSADIPGMENGKEVLQEFLEATDYIKENGYFLQNRSVKYEVTDKKRWLEFRTEEEWDSASAYDVMVYMDIFYHPYYSMMNDNVSSEEEFVEEANDIGIFRKAEGGEGYAAALEKVIRWQYRYYEATGTIYNFFAEEGEENMHLNQVEKDENGLTKEELKELEAAREELLEGKDAKEVLGGKDEAPIVRFMKGHFWAVILLLISACVIAGITLYIKNKTKGADE